MWSLLILLLVLCTYTESFCGSAARRRSQPVKLNEKHTFEGTATPLARTAPAVQTPRAHSLTNATISIMCMHNTPTPSLCYTGIAIDGEITPVGNYVLVKVMQAIEQTSGGIYMPDAAKERPTEGTVMAAGPGRVHPYSGVQLENPAKIGMNVLYGKYDGTELSYDGVMHQLIRDDDILLVYDADADATEESVRCVKDQVLVLLDEASDEYASGLVVKKEQKEYQLRDTDTGVVVKFGPGRQAGSGDQMQMQIAKGDRVKFRDYAGANVKLGNKEYAVIRAYDILAKI